MFFQKKKIKLETLAEYLKEMRLNLKLSLEEVAKKTGMGAKVLQALEEGKYNLLPSSIYVKGFLKRLGLLYGVDKDILIRQYEIEWKIEKNIKQDFYKIVKKPASWLDNIVITPKNVSFSGAAIFVGATIIYIIWQVLAISRAPLLVITSPRDFTVIDKSFVQIQGLASLGATVSINGEPVFVDQEGMFQGQLGVSPGPNEIVVEAKNRFNKVSSKTFTIIGQNKSTSENINLVRLELGILGDVEITLQIDGSLEESQKYKEGEKKVVEAKRDVLMSASDAAKVRVKINGKNLGLLGRPGEQLTKIPFSAESGIIK